MVKRFHIEDVQVTVAMTRQRLAIMRTRGPISPMKQAEFDTIAAGVEELLRRADDAAAGEQPGGSGRWLPRFWSGRQLEASYPALHSAHVLLVDLYDENELRTAIWPALNTVRRYLDRDDPRRADAETLPSLINHPGPERRAVLKAARENGYRARDLNHRQQRTFRNALIVATVVATILAGALTLFLFAKPQFASLCFESVNQDGAVPIILVNPTPTVVPSAAPTPPSAQPSTGTSAVVAPGAGIGERQQLVAAGRRVNCPTGFGPREQPNGYDIVLVAFLGIIGAAIAATVTVRGLQVTTSPYDVPLALSLLKLPLGAITAFIGIEAIKAGLVPGLSALDSPAQILVYSVLLGYAQQLATVFLDRRATNLGRAEAQPAPLPDTRLRPPANPPTPPGPPPPGGPLSRILRRLTARR